MSTIKNIQAPLTDEVIADLNAGDEVSLSGVIFTARDQAHLRMCKMLKDGQDLPVDLKGQVIYYCGPTPPGKRVIGSCGPTTSSRMDAFSPDLLEYGSKGMIGKGKRSKDVVAAIKKYKSVYFAAPGGAAAYLSERVKSCVVVGFEDLGPEAIYRLEVKDFPLIVCVDSNGNDIYAKLND